MTVEVVKSRWNEVLDHLQSKNRVAWLAFFDARISSVTSEAIFLDFRDANKLGSAHTFSPARNSGNQQALKASIYKVFGEELDIIVE